MALQGSGRWARLTSALSRGSSGRRGAGCGSDRPQHHDLRAALRKIINKEINHFVDNWGEEGQFPAQEVFKTLGQAGFLGAEKTKEYGGMGFDFSYSIAVAEELGRICCGGIPMAIGSASWHGHSCSYKIDKLGMKLLDAAQIFFEDVRAPSKNLIGEEGTGFTYQMLQFQEERLWGVAPDRKMTTLLK